MSSELPPLALVQPSQPEPPLPVPEIAQPVPPSPAQIRAADAVFAEQQQEHSTAAGILGLWSGALLLNDLAKEHFSEPEDEDEREKKKPNSEPEA